MRKAAEAATDDERLILRCNADVVGVASEERPERAGILRRVPRGSPGSSPRVAPQHEGGWWFPRTAGLASLFLLTLLLCFPPAAFAVQPDEMLADPVLEARAREISEGLRCLVCQNQSIDDSNAPLARDLRLLVRERLKAGDSDEAVRELSRRPLRRLHPPEAALRACARCCYG